LKCNLFYYVIKFYKLIRLYCRRSQTWPVPEKPHRSTFPSCLRQSSSGSNSKLTLCMQINCAGADKVTRLIKPAHFGNFFEDPKVIGRQKTKLD